MEYVYGTRPVYDVTRVGCTSSGPIAGDRNRAPHLVRLLAFRGNQLLLLTLRDERGLEYSSDDNRDPSK